ncbi:GDSL-type esterase/lipase family protein [Luteolibacter algae]|uniref:GDSL-type esterase/lipase family protein n=1 Tax=Luteolibacter algae TaxID=454151 RepID=A0ABW5DAU7_9BACT
MTLPSAMTFLLGGLLLAGSVLSKENPAELAVPRDTTGKSQWVANHYKRMMALADKSPEKFRIVFVGDSITKKWLDDSGSLWADNFGSEDSPFYALNLGVPGDRTDHVLYRLKAKEDGGLGNLDNPAIQPEVIVLMIGTNNLFPPHDAEQIAGGIGAVAKRLKDLRPDSKLIICSVIPSNSAQKDEELVIPANATLSALAESMGDDVRYLDLFSPFLDGQGKKNTECYEDGLHLNEKGYEVWFSELMPMLKETLGLATEN